MFSKGSALPPRSLVALIVGITVVPLATLLWLGWRLLEQDRILEAQQAQQRVERAADLAVAALQRAIAADEQRLAAGGAQCPAGAVAIWFRNSLVQAVPRERVAYLPVVKALREAPGSAFAGEDLEFRQRDLGRLPLERRKADRAFTALMQRRVRCPRWRTTSPE